MNIIGKQGNILIQLKVCDKGQVNDSYWILYPRSGAKWWTHISTIKGSFISRKIGEYFDSAQSTGAERLVYPRNRASSTPRLQVVILLCNDVVPTTISVSTIHTREYYQHTVPNIVRIFFSSNFVTKNGAISSVSISTKGEYLLQSFWQGNDTICPRGRGFVIRG